MFRSIVNDEIWFRSKQFVAFIANTCSIFVRAHIVYDRLNSRIDLYVELHNSHMIYCYSNNERLDDAEMIIRLELSIANIANIIRLQWTIRRWSYNCRFDLNIESHCKQTNSVRVECILRIVIDVGKLVFRNKIILNLKKW